MLILTTQEKEVLAAIRKLKTTSGSHSPSVQQLRNALSHTPIEIDACFLSNPYATDLVMDYFQREVVDNPAKFRDFVEYYPSQNQQIAHVLEQRLGVGEGTVFMGNGASEIIQAVIEQYTKTRALIVLPTFSPYYEFVRPPAQCAFFTLLPENNFSFDVQSYLSTVAEVQPDTVVLVNPNNPNGGYIPQAEMRDLLHHLRHIPTVIVDESFIDFAYEDENFSPVSIAGICAEYPNVVLIKSMSKDFGIAGLRVGYAIARTERVQSLLRYGYLWNINGLAEYFVRLVGVNQEFADRYEEARTRYIREFIDFKSALQSISGMRIFPSKANFILAELSSGIDQEAVIAALLCRYGIYIRGCGDKRGLVGNYIRIAGRKADENMRMVSGLSEIVRM